MCEWASPWNSMPMKSHVNRVSPESPRWMSFIIVMWCTTGFGLSGPATVSSGHEHETVRPVLIRPAASLTMSGVM